MDQRPKRHGQEWTKHIASAGTGLAIDMPVLVKHWIKDVAGGRTGRRTRQ